MSSLPAIAAPLPLDEVSADVNPVLAGRPWSRLRAFLDLDRRGLWVVAVYAVVIGGLTLATPIAVQAVVNTIAFGSVLQPLIVLTLLLFGGLAFSGLLSILEAYVVEVLQRRMFVRIAEDFGRRLPRVRAEGLDGKHAPELVNRFFEVLTIQKSVAALLLDGLSLLLQTLMGMLLLAFYHPLLLAFDVVLVVLLLVVLVSGRGAIATGIAESAAKYRTAAWLQDLGRVPSMFRGAAGRRFAGDRIERLCHDYLRARRSHFRILVRQLAGGVMLHVTALVALLGVGGWLVLERQLTLGQLVAAELVVASVGAGFVKVGRSLEKLYDLTVGVSKLSRVVDLPTERGGSARLSSRDPASLALREVTVDRNGRRLLSRASLDVRPGERVRLVGEAASGKSTLLEVLSAARPSSAGSVRVDDIDVRTADLGELRDEVRLVRPMDIVAGTVRDNLCAGNHHLDEPALRGVLRVVDLEPSIDALPDGLLTTLSSSGAPLSESQVRRLSLARALAARPRALLIDGALDGLGLAPGLKASCLEFVLGPQAPWTAIVVTTDDDVAWHCNRTVAFVDGRLEDAA